MKGRTTVKVASLICAIVAVMMFVTWTYAAYVVWSNEVDVTVSEYVLTLVDPGDGTTLDKFTFTGVLTLNGNFVEGATVTLLVNNVETSLTDVTDANGIYSIIWTPPAKGTYTFKARADI